MLSNVLHFTKDVQQFLRESWAKVTTFIYLQSYTIYYLMLNAFLKGKYLNKVLSQGTANGMEQKKKSVIKIQLK